MSETNIQDMVISKAATFWFGMSKFLVFSQAVFVSWSHIGIYQREGKVEGKPFYHLLKPCFHKCHPKTTI